MPGHLAVGCGPEFRCRPVPRVHPLTFPPAWSRLSPGKNDNLAPAGHYGYAFPMTTEQAVVRRTKAFAERGGRAVRLVANFAPPREIALWGLLAWGVLDAIAYPFVRAGPFTFDRLWIPALAVCLLRAPRASAQSVSVPSRLVLGSAIVLVLTYGIRAALTDANTLGALKTWVDAIVLPVLLLVLARQLIREPPDCRRLLGSLAIAGTVLAVIGLLGYVFEFELASLSGGHSDSIQASMQSGFPACIPIPSRTRCRCSSALRRPSAGCNCRRLPDVTYWGSPRPPSRRWRPD